MKQHEVNIKNVTGMVRGYVPSTISWSFQDNSDRPLNMSTDTFIKEVDIHEANQAVGLCTVRKLLCLAL